MSKGGINNTAKTKEGTGGQTRRRFNRTALAVFFFILSLTVFQSSFLLTVTSNIMN